ncbi:MAG: P-type conjugative transfer protein TrbL [Sedimenticola sp.]
MGHTRPAVGGLNRYPQLLLLMLVFTLCPEPVLAAINDDNLIDQVVNTYRTAAGNWQETIYNAAIWMFWILAGIEIAWTGINLILRSSDLGDVLAEITLRVITIGFFLTLLRLGPEWAARIVDSLSSLAGQASAAGGGSGSMSPSGVFDSGLVLGQRLWSTVSFWDSTTDSLGLIFAGLIIIIVFAMITAHLVMAMVEVWVVVNAGIILLGLGASRFTKDFALKYLIYALSVGMKLFIMLLIIGVGQSFINDWVINWENNNAQVMVAIGVSVVLLALVREVPNIMQGLMSGMSFATGDSLVRSGTGAIKTAALAGAAVATAGVAAAGGASAVASATRLAKAQGAEGVAGVAVGAAKIAASAFSSDLGERNRRGGMAGPGKGTGSRMAEAIKAAQKELKEENSISKGK